MQCVPSVNCTHMLKLQAAEARAMGIEGLDSVDKGKGVASRFTAPSGHLLPSKGNSTVAASYARASKASQASNATGS